MGWVSWPLFIFVFLASFSALWWPNIWLKMEFRELKKNYRFHSLDTWHLPLGVSLLTPIHFRVPSLLWQIFWHFPNFLHKLLRYLKYHDTLVGKMMPKFFWNNVLLKNSHLCSTRLQNRNLYWIFLDEVGPPRQDWPLALYRPCQQRPLARQNRAGIQPPLPDHRWSHPPLLINDLMPWKRLRHLLYTHEWAISL